MFDSSMTTKRSRTQVLISAGFLFLAALQTPLTLLAAPSELLDHLTREQQQEIANTGSLFAYSDADTEPTLIPDLAILEELPAVDGGLMAETLYVLPRAKNLESLHLALYNTLLAVSTMEGIEYYSASRERMRLLFVRSHFIRNPENTAPLPDPEVGAIPETAERVLLQEDKSFGTNIYQVRHTYNGSSMRIDITNLETVRYGFFPAIRTGDLSITLAAHPRKEDLVVYGIIRGKPIISLGIRSKIQASISNRLKAVSGWFVREAADILHAEDIPLTDEQPPAAGQTPADD